MRDIRPFVIFYFLLLLFFLILIFNRNSPISKMLVFLGSPAYTHVQIEEGKKHQKNEEMLGDLHVGQVKPNQEEINK